MRFVVYGAGAIGSVVGARLHQGGHAVVLVARGPHLDALRERGLRIEDPERQATLKLDVVGRPADAGIRRGDVALLAVKSHQTAAALEDLRPAAPVEIPIACLQNGVENERAALRLFANVYGAAVLCPAAHLEPGVVQAYAARITGILDVGTPRASTTWPGPSPRRCARPAGSRGRDRLPPRRGHRVRDSRRGAHARHRAEAGGRQGAAGRLHLAEPRAEGRVGGEGPPERRGGAPRPAARYPDAGERAPPAARERVGARGARAASLGERVLLARLAEGS